MALQELQLKISGMSCGHCEQTVSKALLSLDGVERAVADHRNGTVTVRFDNARVSIGQLQHAVNETEIYAATEVIYP